MNKELQGFIEIVGNPHDLSVAITTEDERFGFIITRGESKRFALIAKAKPTQATIDDAVELALTFLTSVVDSMQLVPEYEGAVIGPTLTHTLIDQIRSALYADQIANTWDMV